MNLSNHPYQQWTFGIKLTFLSFWPLALFLGGIHLPKDQETRFTVYHKSAAKDKAIRLDAIQAWMPSS